MRHSSMTIIFSPYQPTAYSPVRPQKGFSSLIICQTKHENTDRKTSVYTPVQECNQNRLFFKNGKKYLICKS